MEMVKQDNRRQLSAKVCEILLGYGQTLAMGCPFLPFSLSVVLPMVHL